MTTSFANGTSVTVEKTRTEIEKLLMQRGAAQFGTITDIERGMAIIGFKYKGLQIQMQIPLPDRKHKDFTMKKKGWGHNTDEKAYALYEGEIRRRWRCLALALKAKMVSVADGVTTFEKEFLPYVVTADGTTIGDKLAPMLEAAKATGLVPATLMLTEAQ